MMQRLCMFLDANKALIKRWLPNALVVFAVFFILLPVAASINFYQNDDWVYYKNVSKFSTGDFSLDPITAPTFYTQGVLGLVFSSMFGLNRLPVLTLLVTITAAAVFFQTLSYSGVKDTVTRTLLTGLVFFNPIVVYSMWGFMTENYFLLFSLLHIYFFSKFLNTSKSSDFIIANALLLPAFFVRQLAFVFPIGAAAFLLLKKQYKHAALEAGIFALLFFYYNNLFPKTAEMIEKGLEFAHLADYKYSFALICAIVIYMAAFLVPLVFAIAQKYISTNRKLLLPAVVLTGVIYIAGKYFDPHVLAWGEFPYLDNIFERKGFFPRSIGGTKYYFSGIYDLYKYWEILAKIAGSTAVALFLLKVKQGLNYYLVTAAAYVFVLLIAQKTYDRYLILLLPLIVLGGLPYLSDLTKPAKSMFVVFCLFLFVLSYQFSGEFITLNRYIWTRATELSQSSAVPKEQIKATNAWKLTHRNLGKDYMYDFSFDNQDVNEGYKTNYELVEVKNITFPFSLYINPTVYLYKKVL